MLDGLTDLRKDPMFTKVKGTALGNILDALTQFAGLVDGMELGKVKLRCDVTLRDVTKTYRLPSLSLIPSRITSWSYAYSGIFFHLNYDPEWLFAGGRVLEWFFDGGRYDALLHKYRPPSSNGHPMRTPPSRTHAEYRSLPQVRKWLGKALL